MAALRGTAAIGLSRGCPRRAGDRFSTARTHGTDQLLTFNKRRQTKAMDFDPVGPSMPLDKCGRPACRNTARAENSHSGANGSSSSADGLTNSR